MYVIPTGNELGTKRDPQARASVRAKYGIPETAQVLLYVGRVAREKNLGLLFAAFDRLAQTYASLYLFIVGGGPWEVQARRLASSLKAASRVVFSGPVSRKEVAAYYSAGDIFTFPSMTETQGLVLSEALGAGLPCVAVRAGGSPEMLVEGEDSLLSENDVDDFAAKIKLLLADSSLYHRLSSNAEKNASRFSTSEMVRRVLTVYETVLSRDEALASCDTSLTEG